MAEKELSSYIRYLQPLKSNGGVLGDNELPTEVGGGPYSGGKVEIEKEG